MPTYNQILVDWLDANGLGGQNFLSTQDQTAGTDGAYAALATALTNISDAGLVAITFQKPSIHTPAAGSGPYKSCSDRAVFNLRSSANTAGTLNVVAPKSSIFLSDNKTVDMSNSLVVALVTAVTGVLGDSHGNPWVTVKQGFREKVRKGYSA